MDGHGESLVAMFQGLDTPEVTLTVCSRPRQQQDRRRTSRHRIHPSIMKTPLATSPVCQKVNAIPAIQRSTVQTSTECEKGTDCARCGVGAQICDGRYASSYKLAHCMVTPTSPPEAVTEFPPQRKEPCRNQGNFEIGHNCRHGGGHSGTNVRVSTSKVRHYRGNQMWGEKGSAHRSNSYRDMEAFAQTLRKYPGVDIAPYRTASSDLIDKIIRYTQAKNILSAAREGSLKARSMRCLQRQKSPEPNEMTRTSKYQQTYTGRQNDNALITSHVHDGCKDETRNFKLYPPIDARKKKDSRSAYGSSYDYLKAGKSCYGQPYNSEGSPNPKASRSHSGSMSPVESRNPMGSRSRERLKNPDRPKSRRSRRPDKPGRLGQPVSSVQDLSLSDMSKYIRNITLRQMCRNNPLVFQVCPKLRNRYIQHKKICPSKDRRSSDFFENTTNCQASGSILSRLMTILRGGPAPSTTRDKCQGSKTDFYDSKTTQCALRSIASLNKAHCNCIPSAVKLNRIIPCSCCGKYQAQDYYKKRVDEEISEWLQDVPLHSLEGSGIKKKRETDINKIKKTLKQLPFNESFNESVANEIYKFVDDFPMLHPGTDMEDDKSFRNHLAHKLIVKIIGIPRKSDRFKDIVEKWIANIDLQDGDEEIDTAGIIDNIVNKLKTLATNRPVCDAKYKRILNLAIIELLLELSLFNGDMITLVKITDKLATEIVNIPKNVDLLGDLDSDMTNEFESIICDWICERNLCKELKKDPKLITSLAKKLKSQRIDDNIKEEKHQLQEDDSIADKKIDVLIDGEQINTVGTNERLNQNNLIEVIDDWLLNFPGITDLHPREFANITKELADIIQKGKTQGNENLRNDIVNSLVTAGHFIDSAELTEKVEELLKKLNILPSNIFYKEQAKIKMLKHFFDIIDRLPIPKDKMEYMKSKARVFIHENVDRSLSKFQEVQENVKDSLLAVIGDIISDTDMIKQSKLIFNSLLDNESLKSVIRFSNSSVGSKRIIAKDAKSEEEEDKRKNKKNMQQVKGTLSKNIDKQLLNNVNNTINNEISDIVDNSPISEDRGVLSCLKKLLLAVASKHLSTFLPKVKCVFDIQSKVEKDVGVVIDEFPMDASKKKDLKKCICDILTDNEDFRLSDEVVKTIKQNIKCAVSDLSIPEEKKAVLECKCSDTVSKDVNEALATLRHDLNKIRSKLLDDIINVIEKYPISRDIKINLINKLNSMLAKNFDSLLLNEEKDLIIDDVSNIFEDTMPEDERRRLENRLAKTLDTQTEEEQERLTGMIDHLLNNTLREMEQAVIEAQIPISKKIALEKKLREMTIDHFKIPLSNDLEDAFNYDINDILDKMNLPKDETNKLKNKLIRTLHRNTSNFRKEMDSHIKSRRKTSENKGKNSKEIKGEKSSSLIMTDTLSLKESMKKEVTNTNNNSGIPKERQSRLGNELTMLSDLSTQVDNPSDEDIGVTRKTAVKDGENDMFNKYGKDLSYENKLAQDFHDLSEKDLKRGDLKCARRKHIEKIMQDAELPEEKATDLADVMIGRPQKKVVKDDESDIFNEYGKDPSYRYKSSEKFNNLGEITRKGEDLEDAIRKHIEKIIRYMDSSEEVSTARAGKMVSSAQKMEVKDDENDMFDKYGIDPSNKNILTEEFNNLVEQDLESGDLEHARRKYIEKIIKYTDLPEEEATALADLMIGRPQKMVVKDDENDMFDKYGIDSSYKNILTEEFNNLVEQDLESGDLEHARRKYIEKIIQHTDLPEEEATALADVMIGRPQKMVVKDDENHIFDKYGIDPSNKNILIEEFNNLVEQDLESGDLEHARRKYIEKITHHTDLPEEEATALADVMIGRPQKMVVKDDESDIYDKYGKDPIYKNKSSEKFNNLGEITRKCGDLEHVTRKHIEKNIRDMDSSEEESTARAGKMVSSAQKMVVKGDEKSIFDKYSKDASYKNNLSEEFNGIRDIALLEEKKDLITDDVSDIFKDTMPEDKRRQLENSLAKTLDTQTEEKQERLTEIIDHSLYNTLREVEQAINKAQIPITKKIAMKKKLREMAIENFKTPPSDDLEDDFNYDINDILDKMNLPNDEKNKLKSELTSIVHNNTNNLRNKMGLDTKSSRRTSEQGLKSIKEVGESIGKVSKEEKSSSLMMTDPSNLKEKIKKTNKNSDIPKVKYNKLSDLSTQVDNPSYDDIGTTRKTAVKDDVNNIFDKYGTDPSYKNILTEEFNNLGDTARKGGDLEHVTRKHIEKIIQDMDSSEEESTARPGKMVGSAQKMVVKGDEKSIFEKYGKDSSYKNNLSEEFNNLEDIALLEEKKDIITDNVSDIFKDTMPEDKRRQLENSLAKTLDTQTEGKQERLTEIIDHSLYNTLREVEQAINKAQIPITKKIAMKKKLREMAIENFKTPSSDDLEDDFNYDINDILDKMNLPNDERNKLKSELTSIVHNNTNNLRKKMGLDTKSSRRTSEQGLRSIKEVGESIGKVSKEEKSSSLMMTDPSNLKEKVKKTNKNSDIPKEKYNELSDLLTQVDNPSYDDIGTTRKSNSRKEIDLGTKSRRETSEQGLKSIKKVEENKRKSSTEINGLKSSSLLMADPLSRNESIKQKVTKTSKNSGIPKERQSKLENEFTGILSDLSTQVDNSSDENISTTRKTAVIDGKEEKSSSLLMTDPLNLKESMKEKVKKTNKKSEIPKEKHSKLSDLSTQVDNSSDDDIGTTRKTAVKNEVNNIFDKYGKDSNYENKLQQEFSNLLEKDLNSGDLKDARRKHIEKTMQNMDLSEEEAVTLADVKIGRARKMVVKDDVNDTFDKYGVNPTYKNKLRGEFNNLGDIALSDEEKNLIIDDVSDILKHTMPKDERRLENRLANTLETQSEEEQERLTEIIDDSLTNTLREVEQAINEAEIPTSKRTALERKLREMAIENFKTPLSDGLEDAFNYDINDILDKINLPKDKTNTLKSELTGIVRKTTSNLRKEMDLDTKSRRETSEQGLRSIKKVDENKRKTTTEINEPKSSSLFMTDPLSRNESIKQKVTKTSKTSGIPKERQSKLENEFTGILSDLSSQVDNSSDENYSTIRKTAVIDDKKNIFEKYGIDPSYENKLAEEFNNLVDKDHMSEDLEDARKNIIKKIKRDTDFSEEEATALVDVMISRPLKMLVKDDEKNAFDKYGIDPSYENKLAEEFNNLVDQDFKSQDLGNARRKLIEKIKRDTDLSEKEATTLASEMIGKTRKMLQDTKAQDSNAITFTYEKNKPKATSNAADQTTFFESDKDSTFKNPEDLSKNEVDAVKDKFPTESYNIVDATSIPNDVKNKFKLLAIPVYEDEVGKCIKAYTDKLGIKLEPTILETLTNNVVGDLIDRQKYLIANPELKVTDEDEMENFNYHIYKRAKNLVGLKKTVQIMKKIGDLYKLIMALGPPLPSAKLRPSSMKEQAQPSETRRQDQAALNKKTTDTTLHSESINYALKESLARNKSVRKQWSKNIDYMNTILLTSTSRSNEEGTRSKNLTISPKNIQDTSPSPLEKLIETLTYNNTIDIQSPFAKNSIQYGKDEEKEFANSIKDNLKTWLKNAGVEIEEEEKDTILNELTRDLVDRQKFFQIYGSDRPSERENLEYLQLQVYRRLNALVPSAVMKRILKDSEEPLEKVINIDVPLMVAPPQSVNNKRRERNSVNYTNEYDKGRERNSATSTNGHDKGRERYSGTSTNGHDKGRERYSGTSTNEHDKGRERNSATSTNGHDKGRERYSGTSTNEHDKGRERNSATSTNGHDKGRERYSGTSTNEHVKGRVRNSATSTNEHDKGRVRNSATSTNEHDKGRERNSATSTNGHDKGRERYSGTSTNEHDVGRVRNSATSTNEHDKGRERYSGTSTNGHDKGRERYSGTSTNGHDKGRERYSGTSTNEHDKGRERYSGTSTNEHDVGRVRNSSTSTNEHDKGRERYSGTSTNGHDKGRERYSGTSTNEHDKGRERNSATSTNNKNNAAEQEVSGVNFSPGQTSTPTKPKNNSEDTGKENIDLKNKLREIVTTWIETMRLDLEPDVKTEVIDGIAADAIERLTYLNHYPEKAFTKEDEIENLRFHVVNRISKVMEPNSSLNISKKKIEELYRIIMGLGRSLTPEQETEFQNALDEEIAATLSYYHLNCQYKRVLQSCLACELLKLKDSDTDQDAIVEDLITIINRFNCLKPCYPCADEAEEIALKLLYKAKKLLSRIQESEPADINGSPVSGSDVKDRYGMSFNGLTNFINTKLSSINADDGENTNKEIAYSLIQRIGEMNIDPAIFNDDALYEAVLRDELQNLLGDVTISEDEMKALKEDLMKKIIAAHHRAHDEIAGQVYKQNLRDTITKLLPDPCIVSIEQEASLETLKDQLADAFIDLHYSGGNEDQINKLKRKISDEISEFCKIYLNTKPCSPIISQKFSRDLYTALVNVPLPVGDSIMYEVEQARIREAINDWLRELPLEKQNPKELLARNKMIYVLSKKLFDIEVETDDASKELMKKEIVKFLNKMPVQPGDDNENLADKLINKLRVSEESRKYDASSNVTIDDCGNVSAISPGSDIAAGSPIRAAFNKLLLDKQNASGFSNVCGQPCNKPPKPSSSSTLSPEDRAHLDSIKRRNYLTPDCVRAIMRKNKCSTGTGPWPVDAESQTILRPFSMEIPQQSPMCPIANDKIPRPGVAGGPSYQPCSQVRRPESCGIDKPFQGPSYPASASSRPCPQRSSPQSSQLLRRHTISSGNMPECLDEVQPQIFVKQYYWTPPLKSSFEEIELQQKGRGRRQPDNQSSPAQNSTPCDQSFMSFDPKSQRPTCPRSPRMRSPCTSPFGFDSQNASPSPGFSRDNSRIPKRDGLSDQIHCTSSNGRPFRKERVIELGSLDDLCNPRPKQRNNENTADWSDGKVQEDDNFWTTPMRRVILDEGVDEPLILEREQREDRMRCKCRERLIPKCGRPQSRSSPVRQPCSHSNENGQNLNNCSRCCGSYCPYPSYLYFR